MQFISWPLSYPGREISGHNDKEYSPAATNTGEDMVGGTVLLNVLFKMSYFQTNFKTGKKQVAWLYTRGKK